VSRLAWPLLLVWELMVMLALLGELLMSELVLELDLELELANHAVARQ